MLLTLWIGKLTGSVQTKRLFSERLRQLGVGLALLVAGCSPPREALDQLVIWHQKTGAERIFFEALVADYNQDNPDVKIRALYREGEELRNSFIIAAVAGQGPDLVFGPADNVGVFSETQTIRPWGEVLSQDFFDLFTPDGIVRWRGHPWMVADQVGNQLMLVYDRALIDQPPETLDELISLSRRITAAGENPRPRYALTWNYAEPYFFIPFLTGFGGWIMDANDNPTLDTPQTRQALQFILDLRDKYQVIPRYEDYNTANLMFLRRRAAMIINGPWSWAEYGVPERSMLALLPVNTATGLRCRPILAAKGYCLNINTPPAKFDLVRRVLHHLTGEEVQLRMATHLFTTPTLKTVIKSREFLDNPVSQLALEQSRHAIPMPLTPRLRYIWDGIRGPYRQVIAGEITPAEGARRMQEGAEKQIAEGLR